MTINITSRAAEMQDAVQRILGNEGRFGDGPPHWVEGTKQRFCQTAEEAEGHSRWLARHLAAAGQLRTTQLAARLDRCRAFDRCASGACPQCMRAVQRSFVSMCEALFEGQPAELMRVVSIIPTVTEAGIQRPTRTIREARVALRIGCRRAGFARYIGGVDVSWNETRSGSEAGFVAHAWLISLAALINRGALARAFLPAAEVPRPVVVQRFNGSATAFAYALKPKFDMRVTLEPSDEERASGVRRNTRARPLRVQQAVELALMLDQAGLAKRLLMQGIPIRALS